ncbi:MAG: lamin tail domain-containing protein [Chloroflexota bacterium]|nr:lamin tail domain-containing protein [Chloroflexota bacterium]
MRNACSKGKSLSNWRIKDAAGHTYTFGTYTLKAGSYVKIHTGKGSNTATDRYWGRTWYVWNNDKDTAKLLNGSGTLIHSCSYNTSSVSSKTCS